MSTTTRTRTHFRRTQRGEWVVCGPASIVRPGPVVATRKDGTTTTVDVVRTGKPFRGEGGEELVYGYLLPQPRRGRATSRRTWRCASGHDHPVTGCADCFDEFDI